MKIDLIPLQDVMFAACIFLVIALSYSHEHAIDIQTPNYRDMIWCCDGCESMVVTVDRTNNIWIEDRLVMNNELPELLKGAKYNGAVGMGVNIRAELRSNVATYNYIVESARLAGINNVQLVPYDDVAHNK